MLVTALPVKFCVLSEKFPQWTQIGQKLTVRSMKFSDETVQLPVLEIFRKLKVAIGEPEIYHSLILSSLF